MNVTDPRPDASTTDLVREALDEARQLVKLEVELAKQEVREELHEAKRAAVMFGIAAVAALLAAAMLFVALALAIFPGPVPALVIGAVLVAAAAVLGVVAWRTAPKKPLDRTRRRLETDKDVIKEGLA
ncbi:MAG: phage holin family protein [Deltaproteobacteria bacterium]|nr:phage holin family protein [Deltaproteobacteria bacterium]